MTWVSRDGLAVRDLVPADLRRQWVERGHCPNRDLYTLFRGHVDAHPERVAVVDGSVDHPGELTYAALDARVRRLAATLAAADLGPRDVIAIQVPGGRHAVVAELAVAALGALALPYPAGPGTRDTVSLLGRSRARAVITGTADLAAQVRSVRHELPRLRQVLVFGPALDGTRSLDELPTDSSWAPEPVDAEAPARVLVSSGSEAEPKMVAYSHNAMCGGRANYLRAVRGANPRDLVLVPLASSFGSFGVPSTIAAHGGTLVLAGTFGTAGALRTITRHRPAHVFAVPTMLRRMAEAAPSPGEDLSFLRAVVASGADLPAATVEACRRRFGCPVINVYGSSDGVNCHTRTPGDGVGVPDPAVADVRVMDGEIQARGPMTPLCYVGSAELDARYRLPGGWVRTGDRGAFDERGTLHVMGRLRQVAVRGGQNISLAEVERHLGTHPAVAEVACVAVADPDLGERVCAFVQTRRSGPTPTLAELVGFLERTRGLERRKLPEHLVIVAELPLGPTGKVCRRTLADRSTAILGGREAAVT
ncbi:class I adenylate-forming enzyme family protein [Actinophytocola sp.]|uniref:class I adenylate-forming enzyme family protein n=1 Tax=Actinophytocola sp. TaxID=1872138 RepID=UPI003D6A9E6E